MIKKFNNFDKINEGVMSWEDYITNALAGDIYYMPKGTMVLKDRTKVERAITEDMWLNVNNSATMDDVIYYRSYPADYTVKIANLESEPQKDLKKRYLEFKKSQKVASLEQSKADWGFGDEGETGTNPKVSKAQSQIDWIDTLINKQ